MSVIKKTYTWDWFATVAVSLVAANVFDGSWWQRFVVIVAVWSARLLAVLRLRRRVDEVSAFADFYLSNYSKPRE